MSIITDARLFVGTLQNDKYLYEDAIKLGIVQPRSFYGLPAKITNILGYKVIRYAFVVIFPFLYLIYVIFCLISSLLKLKRGECLECGNYFIADTNFSKSINNRINKYIGDSCWILNDGVEQCNYIITSGKYVSCYELVSFIDLVCAALSSVLVLFMIYSKYGTFYMTSSLNAYKWLVYWRACITIPEESSIYCINHKDRWAYLEDHILCKTKTLIQHGTEVGNCSNVSAKERSLLSVVGGGWCQNLPYKYRTLTKVVAFSEKEVSAMSLSIIGCNPEFVVGGYGFDTYKLPTDRFSVLLIAHSESYFDIECEIIKILSDLPIDIYVKNHPLLSNDSFIELEKSYKFTLITEQRFPHVDLAIAYDSTLAHEYTSVGIPVIYHTKNSIEEIIKYIKAKYEKK